MNRHYLQGHDFGVTCVAYSPDGKTLASGSYDKKIILWDADTGQRKVTLEGNRDTVMSIAYSPDGKTLATVSYDKKIMLWDLKINKYKFILERHNCGVTSVAYSPDGTTLATGNSDNKIRLWDTESGKHKFTLKGHSRSVTCVAYSPDGKTLASSGSWDHKIKLWDMSTREHKFTLKGDTNYWVKNVVYSPDSKTLTAKFEDGKVMLLDVVTGKHKGSFEDHHTARIENEKIYSPDGKTYVSKDSSGIYLVDALTGEFKDNLEHCSSQVYCVCFSPDGTILATSRNNDILLRDVSTGKHKTTIKGHSSDVNCMVYSPDGSRLVTGSSDKSVKIWRIEEIDGVTKATLVSSTNHPLFLAECNIEGVRGLSKMNKKLLEQRGAVGEPGGTFLYPTKISFNEKINYDFKPKALSATEEIKANKMVSKQLIETIIKYRIYVVDSKDMDTILKNNGIDKIYIDNAYWKFILANINKGGRVLFESRLKNEIYEIEKTTFAAINEYQRSINQTEAFIYSLDSLTGDEIQSIADLDEKWLFYVKGKRPDYNPEHMKAFESLLSLEKTLAKKYKDKNFQEINIEEFPSIQIPSDISEDILSTFETMTAA